MDNTDGGMMFGTTFTSASGLDSFTRCASGVVEAVTLSNSRRPERLLANAAMALSGVSVPFFAAEDCRAISSSPKMRSS